MPTKRILLFESEESSAEEIIAAFSGYDASVEVSAEGKDAIDVARRESPDLIILRVELPQMSGYSICKKLKKESDLKEIPLIIISSEATDETFDQHKKLKTRAEAYIAKPFSAEQLIDQACSLVSLEEVIAEVDEVIALDEDSVSTDDSLSFDDISDLSDDISDLSEVEEDLGLDAEPGSTLLENESESEEVEGDLDHFESFEDLSGEEEITRNPQSGSSEDLNADELQEMIQSIEGEELESSPADEAEPAENSVLGETEDVLGSMLDDLDSADVSSLADAPATEAAPETDDPLAGLGLGDLEEIEAGVQPADAKDPLAESFDLDFTKDSVEKGAALEALEPAPLPKRTPEQPSAAEWMSPLKSTSPQSAPSQTADPVLQTKLQQADHENGLLREKIGKLEARIEEMHESFEKRESEIGSLRSKTTSKDKEFLALKSANNTKDREILELKEEIQNKEQEILDHQERMAERDREIAKQQEATAKRDRELKEQADRFETLLRKKNDLESLHAGKMAEWEERTTGLEGQLRAASEELKKSQAEHKRQIDQAQRETKQVKTELEETLLRHKDELFGLRARSKQEVERLEGRINDLSGNLKSTQESLEKERQAHEATRQEAARVPGLESSLSDARETIRDLQETIEGQKTALAENEERIFQAYQKIKRDEKLKEKARKAIEIAFTLLADEVNQDSATKSEVEADELQPRS